MKKIFSIMMMAAAVALVSCGDASGEEGEVTACSCLTDTEALAKKMTEAGDDEAKAEALTKEAMALDEKCKDFTDEDYKACK
jgi:hypothetical protein